MPSRRLPVTKQNSGLGNDLVTSDADRGTLQCSPLIYNTWENSETVVMSLHCSKSVSGCESKSENFTIERKADEKVLDWKYGDAVLVKSGKRSNPVSKSSWGD